MSAVARRVMLNPIVDSADSWSCKVTNKAITTCSITGLRDYTLYSVTVVAYTEPQGGIGGGIGMESPADIIRTAPGSMRFVCSAKFK